FFSFFLLLLPPPRSTLFPYTTLFRSFNSLAIFGGDVAVAFAEFLLDRFELLAQQELALPLLHAFLDFATDLVLERGIGENLAGRSEEHTSELQSRFDLVCRLLLEKKK